MSPKRKRSKQDVSLHDAPSPSRLRTTDLAYRQVHEDELAISPPTIVEGRFRNLDLEEGDKVPRRDFGRGTATDRRATQGFPIPAGFDPQITLPNRTLNAPITPPSSSNGPPLPLSDLDKQGQSDNPSLEIPETPRLRPVSSPTPPPSVSKPCPLFANSKSPPPFAPLSPTLWWTDTEITGYNPTDPTDDGYGINGVGFLPTPAIANARAERRKRQVAEWKNREAREARQKRSDRRRRREGEAAAMEVEQRREVEEGRKVRFLEV